MTPRDRTVLWSTRHRMSLSVESNTRRRLQLDKHHGISPIQYSLFPLSDSRRTGRRVNRCKNAVPRLGWGFFNYGNEWRKYEALKYSDGFTRDGDHISTSMEWYNGHQFDFMRGKRARIQIMQIVLAIFP